MVSQGGPRPASSGGQGKAARRPGGQGGDPPHDWVGGRPLLRWEGGALWLSGVNVSPTPPIRGCFGVSARFWLCPPSLPPLLAPPPLPPFPTAPSSCCCACFASGGASLRAPPPGMACGREPALSDASLIRPSASGCTNDVAASAILLSDQGGVGGFGAGLGLPLLLPPPAAFLPPGSSFPPPYPRTAPSLYGAVVPAASGQQREPDVRAVLLFRRLFAAAVVATHTHTHAHRSARTAWRCLASDGGRRGARDRPPPVF